LPLLKTVSKNIFIIVLLVVVNLAIFVFCKIVTSEENYIWYKISNEKATLLAYACLDLMRIRYFVYANSINFFLLGIYFAFNYRKTLGIIVVFLSVGIYWGGTKLFEKNMVDNYYTIFKNQAVSDDFIIEPIKSAGYEIGPYLMNDITASYSTHRKYAIIGVGELQYEPAVEALNGILQSPIEKPDIRGEAYQALLKINTEKSVSYARIFLGAYHPSRDENVMQYLNITPQPEIK
jgi:hypothetical protein